MGVIIQILPPAGRAPSQTMGTREKIESKTCKKTLPACLTSYDLAPVLREAEMRAKRVKSVARQISASRTIPTTVPAAWKE